MKHKLSTNVSLEDRFDELYNAGFYTWGGLGGTKAPYGRSWQRFGNQVPSNSEIDDLFDLDPQHVGIILPKRELDSGGQVRLTVFDCECEEVAEEVRKLIDDLCPELKSKIAYRRNRKSGGMHVFIQHPPDTRFPKVRLHDERITLKKAGHGNAGSAKAPLVFETLGTDDGAKYCIVYAEGRENASETKITDIRTLTVSEMEKLEQVLERLSELHPVDSSKKKASGKKRKKHDSKYPIELQEFDADIDVRELLEFEGWSFDHEDENRWYYTRPGKSEGVSASISKETQLLHVFSSSTEFEEGENYRPFQVYALLKHGIKKGYRYGRAVKALKTQLYQESVLSSKEKTPLTLPSKGETISKCAKQVFSRFGTKKELFWRGGKVQEILQNGEESFLETMEPARLCSVLERYFAMMKWCDGKDGPDLRETPCTETIAKLLLAADAARKKLPEIAILSSCPILDRQGRVVQAGYDAQTKCYVLKKVNVRIPPVETAVKRINGLLRDFSFQSDADRSRGIAALLTPALSLSGQLNRSPLHFLEADQSQTGKGFFVRTAASIYGEQARLVTQRNGGVGSFDESLAARLAAGNPFISIDNLRGRLDSQYLEALLTAEGLFGVRIPYKGEIQIDSRPFCLFGTSNAVELTRDTANRMSIIRLRKQPEGYRFKQWKEGDLIEHIRANQGHLLGAVFSVLQTWIAGGKPRTDEPRHDFREWAQSLDWIVQHIFQAAPLMDGFLEAKERVTNNSLGFIRQLAVVIENTGQLRRPFSASELYSLCESHGIDVLNCKGDDDKAGQMQIGRILRQAFIGKERLAVDEYMIRRTVGEVRRDDGKGKRSVKHYEFYKQSSALTSKK